MNRSSKKALLWGFGFGAVGLYGIAMLALISAHVERVVDFLFWPGRSLAAIFVGSEGSNLEVVMLTIANGLLYAFLFFLINFLRESLRQK